ncbi:MAG: hypothetical protein VB128_01680 [Sedimentibacter saalensis]|uniref:hypothetical protein n=1 Tax=Sedimentibacter saalensis TaxID=130788 RepID=UPI002B1F696B|nr:hypothetical protein [Sedimentibacter saalensis]MEA5093642.1 hypothetical protein [Sedimentibacter saalensis]
MDKNKIGYCSVCMGLTLFSLDMFLLKIIQLLNKILSLSYLDYPVYPNPLEYIREPIIAIGISVPIIMLFVGFYMMKKK